MSWFTASQKSNLSERASLGPQNPSRDRNQLVDMFAPVARRLRIRECVLLGRPDDRVRRSAGLVGPEHLDSVGDLRSADICVLERLAPYFQRLATPLRLVHLIGGHSRFVPSALSRQSRGAVIDVDRGLHQVRPGLKALSAKPSPVLDTRCEYRRYATDDQRQKRSQEDLTHGHSLAEPR